MQVWIPQGDGSGNLIKVLQEDIFLLADLFKHLHGSETAPSDTSQWRRHFFYKLPAGSFSRKARERLVPLLPSFGVAELEINDTARPGPSDSPFVSLVLRAEKAVSVLITDSAVTFADATPTALPTTVPKSPPLRVHRPSLAPQRSFLEQLME